MDKAHKSVVGALLLIVAAFLGFFTAVAYSANSSPTMTKVFTLVYVLGTASAFFLVSGIWIMVSARKAQNK
jgi:hypothetical protein